MDNADAKLAIFRSSLDRAILTDEFPSDFNEAELRRVVDIAVNFVMRKYPNASAVYIQAQTEGIVFGAMAWSMIVHSS